MKGVEITLAIQLVFVAFPPPPPPKSTQPKMQVATSMQVTPRHMPQSAGQLTHVSNSSPSHMPLPHTEHTPQSAEQLAQSSGRRHRPSPQGGHRPQSAGQVEQFSMPGVHSPLPHSGQGSQSAAQVRQSSPSPARQKPSPQVRQAPQSPGQLLQDSVA